jgi:transcriptional regulator with XRE-family HTH domain
MDQGVGHEVKRLREERGWSQAKLAVEADMSVSGVSMIENGQRNLTTTTLAKLANAFSVEVADLFPKGQLPLPEGGAAKYLVSAEDLAKMFRNLARRGQRIVERSVSEGASEELSREAADYHEDAVVFLKVKGGRDIRGEVPEELAEAVEDYEEVEARIQSLLAQDLSADEAERAESARFKKGKRVDYAEERGASAS